MFLLKISEGRHLFGDHHDLAVPTRSQSNTSLSCSIGLHCSFLGEIQIKQFSLASGSCFQKRKLLSNTRSTPNVARSSQLLKLQGIETKKEDSTLPSQPTLKIARIFYMLTFWWADCSEVTHVIDGPPLVNDPYGTSEVAACFSCTWLWFIIPSCGLPY